MFKSKFLLVLLIVLCSFQILHAQDAVFESVAEFQSTLDAIISIEIEVERTAALDALWTDLVDAEQIPLTIGETAIFLYRGEAETVEWRGDFTFWERDSQAQGERQGETDLWMMTMDFDADARYDYKIVLNGDEWILDPANPRQQVGGFGPNSYLAMPDYVPPTTTIRRDDVPQGELSDNLTIFSRQLNYALHYRVYTPADYATLDDLPVIYVMDCQEYADDTMGAMVIVLDNLIADALIQPVIAVFIDARSPENLNDNRRMSEFINNEAYGSFVATELVTTIDNVYDTNRSPDARAILGTSLGGLNAALIGYHHSDVFHLIGIHSPAFWVYQPIFGMYRQSEQLPLKIFMSTGTPYDGDTDAQQMRDILEERAYPLMYMEVHDGHSWGNWRALIDDTLLYFFGL